MIKTDVFKALIKVQGTFTRQDIQKAIWVAQNNPIKTYVARQGYYADAIQGWETEGTINRVKRGVYEMTERGKLFTNDRKAWLKSNRDRVEKRRQERIEKHKQQMVERAKEKESIKFHSDKFKHLVGRKIVNVRFMQPSEREHFGWYNSPLILELDDKTCLIPMQDDEGNDGGSMRHYDYKDIIGR
jgi:hypothetical protein